MKKCPFCAEDIQDAAIVCKHCHRDLPAMSSDKRPTAIMKDTVPVQPPRRGSWWPALAILGIFALLSVIAFLTAEKPLPSKAAASAAQERADLVANTIDPLITKLEGEGLIKRIDVARYEAQVNPIAWAVLDFDHKKDFARLLALYCEQHGGSSREYVDVIDSQSGKKLAHYGFGSFEVF